MLNVDLTSHGQLTTISKLASNGNVNQ